jgi:hypothetical protein
MPGKKAVRRQKKILVTVTPEEVRSYITLKDRHAKIGKQLETYKTKFNEYAESVGFEEDRKVVIEREGHTVTVTETAQIKVSPEALNIIESSRRFRRFKDCIETVKVVNSEILMQDLEKALLNKEITKEDSDKIITTTYGTRVTM